MRNRSALSGACLLLAALAGRAAGQTSTQAVRGVIVDERTAAPIQGAFIQLVDSANAARDGVLSDEAGRFILDAPRPGRYTLRAERIGYASSFSDTLLVGAGKVVTYHFSVPVQAISLEGLEVTGKRRCRLSRESGTATSVLWDEARKALDVVAWMEKQRGVPYQAVVWDRTRDLLTMDVEKGERHIASSFGRSAFRSATAEDLEKHGFVRRAADGTFTYYGLDAQDLLSDAFLAGHCFRVTNPENGEEGLIGLSFEPLDRSGPPDIEGTLWLDRKTSQLRYLQFEYTRHLFATGVPNDLFGGRIDFLRMANGAWIVGKWWLRMPSWGEPLGPAPEGGMPIPPIPTPRERLIKARAEGLRIHEQGAEVDFVGRPGSTTSDGTAVLDGTVYDSVDSRPLAGATVFLTDAASKAVVTDMLGRFHLAGLPAGRHIVAFFHPFTDSLEIPLIVRLVVLTRDRHTSVSLAVPSSAGCRPSLGSGPIVGFVESVSDGRPLGGVEVRGTWPEARRSGGRITLRKVLHKTTTDARGRYLFCGVALEAPVDLSAEHGSTSRLELATPTLLQQDLLSRDRSR